MTNETIGKCPICSSELEVSKLTCNTCETTIDGHFVLCKFCKLTKDQKAFIDIFIKCRGNIKEVEKELGISYPTVKNKLEDAANALGHKSDIDLSQNTNRKDILDKLNSGEIGVEQAIELMKKQG
jgi:hypothetical protein